MKLEKFTKAELLHIIEAAVGEDEVLRLFNETRHFQKVENIKCWDCEVIERKLQPKEVK